MVASTLYQARGHAGEGDDAAAGISEDHDDVQNVYSNFDMD